MKAINWVRWLLAICVCASLCSTVIGRHKYRHPQPQMYKKSWPVGPRISTMGNSVHISLGPSSYKHNRPAQQHKPTNYRYPSSNPARRPPMFAVLPAWKTQSMMGPLSNQGSLPQRGPIKEFHAMNKPAEYRPDHSVPVPGNRGNVDDDKGPIHTIPAPNLSPADKPYNMPGQSYQQNSEYTPTYLGSPQPAATSYVFGSQGTSLAPQRMTTGPTSPTPTLHRYEVTETNEIGIQDYRTSVGPNYFTPEFDVTRLSDFATTGDRQTNDGFANHPSAGSNSGLIGTSLQFGQQNSPPMQTNLHSSLHVGFPASAIQAQQNSLLDHQSTDLHVGHPAPAGPPLSADQLYDLLNSFPQQFNEQYTTGQQHQQQVLQQQLDQLFQPGNDAQFSQPQMHSFNYDEQSNKQQQQKQQQQQQQQQQQIFVGQDYASGRVTADYILEPDNRESLRKTNVPQLSGVSVYPVVDNSDNNIEYEDTSSQKGLSSYFSRVGGDGEGISSQFYTTLPSREAAEKLAALAAAGNVNSHLLDQLRKQQVNSQVGSNGHLPSNHKDDRYFSGAPGGEGEQQHPRYVHRERDDDENENNRGEVEEEDEEEQRQRGEQNKEEKRPMRIMVPDLEDYSEDLEQRPARGDIDTTRGPAREDYEYIDSEEPQLSDIEEDSEIQRGNGNEGVYRQHLESEFGSRLGSNRKSK